MICRYLVDMTNKIHMDGEKDSAKKVREQMEREVMKSVYLAGGEACAL